jgi:paraquat-inducible protein B
MTEETHSHDAAAELPQVAVRRGRRLSPIWLLPIVAAIIGGWLIYKGVVDAPVTAVIHFDSAAGIDAGKTRVLYRGIPLGKVAAVTLSKDLKGVDAVVDVDPSAEPLLRENTLFWLVTPQVNVTEVTGLETILTGQYITLRPGDGKPARSFKALGAPPAIAAEAPGRHLILVADELPSVQQGSPVFYRRLQVGAVQGYTLAADKKHFEIRVHIEPDFAQLVRKRSRFWNASGIHISGSLSNFELRTESLASLIKGGIGFFTPEYAENDPPAKNSDRFDLYADFQAAQTGVPITIRFPTGEGLTPGQSKVKFKGVTAGFVDKIRVLPDLTGVVVHVNMDPRAEPVLLSGTRFWLVSPKLDITGVSGLETLTSGTYIAIQPGKGNPQRAFTAVEAPTKTDKAPRHLKIVLTAARRGSLKPGSPVYYRQVKVGEVTAAALAETADHVDIYVAIQEKFAPLVREKSRFWNASGIGVDFGLFRGGQIKTESLESVLAGGIAFATPDNEIMGKRVKNGAVFSLSDTSEGEWLTWKPKIPL